MLKPMTNPTQPVEQVESNEVRIVINALGECYRQIGKESEPLGEGSLNLVAVAEKYLTPELLRAYLNPRLSDEPTDDAASQLEATATQAVKDLCEFEFLLAAMRDMTPAVLQFYKAVTATQSLINDSRCRVWGEMHGEDFDSPRHTWLVTEFQAFVGEGHLWPIFDKIAAYVGGEVAVMRESPHLNRYWEDGKNGYNANDPVTMTKATAITGENHGRMERQIELRIDVAGLTSYEQLVDTRDKLELATDFLWADYGVGVI